MSTTQPIRDLVDLSKLKNYYYEQEPNLRNYTMICLGVNSALRISDLLHLKWRDVYDFETKEFQYRIVLKEKKTGKETRVALNHNAIEALTIYQNSLKNLEEDTYIFPGRKDSRETLSRSQAYRIIRHAADELHFEKGISCHSMRKTFGYHAWKKGIDRKSVV